MSEPTPVPDVDRQSLFRSLIEAQDSGQSVPESRKEIAERFGVTEQLVKEIEREGIEQQWPPLD